MKRIFALLFATMLVGQALALGYFEYDGLYYNITSENTVEVGQNYYYDLTTVDIPKSVSYNGVVYSVTSIGIDAFYYCTNLTSVTIPNSVTSICRNAFDHCTSLTLITIPNSVTSIGSNAFNNCTSLTSVTIPNSVTNIGHDAFYYCTNLTSVTIPNSVTSIANYAFFNCTKLISVTIPNSVTRIDTCAFYNCNILASINIPNSVTYIGPGTFDNCNNLDYNVYDNAYYIGNEDNPYLVLMRAKRTTITDCKINEACKFIYDKAFYQCNAIRSINIPNSVIGIGDEAFGGCVITSVSIPNSVKYIGQAAFSNIPLSSVTIPKSVESIGSNAFSANSYLSSVVIEYGLKNIGDEMFWSTGLSSITISNSVERIGNGAFMWCSNLTSVYIPNSVTSIGRRAFYGCTGLKTIIVPESVTSIGNEAFSGFSNIDYVVSMASVPPTMDGDAFTSIDTIHVPINYIDDYKKAPIWKWKVIEPFYSLRVENSTTGGTVAASDSILFDDEIATLTATPNEGYHFENWNDGNTENPRSITINNNFVFSATFAINIYNITINVQNGRIEGANSPFEYGSIATLTATPDADYRFVRWSDGNTENPRSITVTNDFELSAIFENENQGDNGNSNSGTNNGETNNGNGNNGDSNNSEANNGSGSGDNGGSSNSGSNNGNGNDNSGDSNNGGSNNGNGNGNNGGTNNGGTNNGNGNGNNSGTNNGGTNNGNGNGNNGGTNNGNGNSNNGGTNNVNGNGDGSDSNNDGSNNGNQNGNAKPQPTTPAGIIVQNILDIIHNSISIVTDVEGEEVNELNIYSYDNKIVVENAEIIGGEIEVFDINGRLSAKSTANSSRIEIPMPRQSLYIVRVGSYAKRVVVN